MIDKKRIEEEAHNFFEWPDPKRKDHVTLTSCVIFASTIAEMVRAEERERWRDVGGKSYPVYRPTVRVSNQTPLTINEIDKDNL